MTFHWSLCDSKSPQVSWTLLSILAVLNNEVVWMVSTRPLISKFSIPFNNPLVTVPKAPITIGIIVTFIFHIFFSSPTVPGTYPSFHFLSVLFSGQPGQQNYYHYFVFFTPILPSFFFFCFLFFFLCFIFPSYFIFFTFFWLFIVSVFHISFPLYFL